MNTESRGMLGFENRSNGNDFSRKDAKAQSATAFLKGFLCVFAPLREKYFSFPKPQ
jgi:hypothetical protein